MSINIDWDSLTKGPDGLALTESIRDFIHDKFQEVALPHFIRSVQVHSFDFGDECPVVELKDICDPLPDFYEDDDQADENEEEESLASPEFRSPHLPIHPPGGRTSTTTSNPPTYIDTRLPGLRSNLGLADQIASPLLSRSNTPGIPGGTSNLSYFHLPLSANLSGTHTPLAAVASGTTPYASNWPDQPIRTWEAHPRPHSPHHRHPLHQPPQTSSSRPSSRPSTADSFAQTSPQPPSPPLTQQPQPQHQPPADPSADLQIVLHISYSGHTHLSLTAEILLDYPMPSFVGIPLKLNITGLAFDGVALIAYLLGKRRAHFCFLGAEDAEVLLGVEGGDSHRGDEGGRGVGGGEGGIGGLLRRIQVESEIGRKEGGKQVLKNVGKVEKFVLEQVRRIFEDEFVWPSFWTFLV
ncbi:Mitochondrial distribution and morphology protein 12 [Toensbergia leucococca]|nr:Mitochondrial distribution and morphology protein 12 [Toensbergia leucococca]